MEEPRRRRELRLDPCDDAALLARAGPLGFTFQGYIEALIRAHLDRSAQLGPKELQLVGESNQHLVAIVQALRRLPGVPAGLVQSIDAHLKMMLTLIENNVQRWKA